MTGTEWVSLNWCMLHHYFRGSSADRVQNIKAASASFHGLLVPPGGVLSCLMNLETSASTMAMPKPPSSLVMKTSKVLEAGVCQVSTALSAPPITAGFEILERHAHAYAWVITNKLPAGHNQNLAGLDALFCSPGGLYIQDRYRSLLLLMETYVSSFKLLSHLGSSIQHQMAAGGQF
jgi:hypothetical protein